ncbi:MAG: hypothetical protein HOQ07_01985, partial [Sinomonas sp.]|nr:hypothetical protein [Sinomonas sp.]
MTRITINGVSLDPVAQSAGLAAAAPDVSDASASDYILVQTSEPLTDEQRAQLSE